MIRAYYVIGPEWGAVIQPGVASGVWTVIVVVDLELPQGVQRV